MTVEETYRTTIDASSRSRALAVAEKEACVYFESEPGDIECVVVAARPGVRSGAGDVLFYSVDIECRVTRAGR